jgi:hypothetical protein
MKELSSQSQSTGLTRVDFVTNAQRGTSSRCLDRPSPSSLADVIDTVLDKGLVIDIYIRVSGVLLWHAAGREQNDLCGCHISSPLKGV